METTKHLYVEQPWSLADTHQHLTLLLPWTEDLTLTVLLRFIILHPLSDKEIGVQMPVHGAVAQAFLSHLRASHDLGATHG